MAFDVALPNGRTQRLGSLALQESDQVSIGGGRILRLKELHAFRGEVVDLRSARAEVSALSILKGVVTEEVPDAVLLNAADLSDGNTILALRCEGSGVVGAGITSTTVTHKLAVRVNETVYYLLATTNGA